MTIYSKAKGSREVWLLAAGTARGNRQAMMRQARTIGIDPGLKKVLVSGARDWNRDVVRSMQLAGEAEPYIIRNPQVILSKRGRELLGQVQS